MTLWKTLVSDFYNNCPVTFNNTGWIRLARKKLIKLQRLQTDTGPDFSIS